MTNPESTESPTEGLPQAGSIIDDKYVVESVLGIGGMGAVLLAMDRTLGQRVALKVLLPAIAGDPAMVGRFVREAKAAAAIQNDHVVRIFGVGKTEAGLPFIVMEHLTGIGLDEELRNRGPLPISEIADVILEVCRALAHAHAIGIVHRDLKPANLFVCRYPDRSERIKVLDFGISKAEGLGGNVALTATTQVMGTPIYMSPEQVRCTKHVDARADIWSLGVVCYELACGPTPFSADSLPAVIAKIVADAPANPRELRPDLPEAFERLILWCLEKDPARRPQTIRELVPSLRPFASQRGVMAADSILRLTDPSALATGIHLDVQAVYPPTLPGVVKWSMRRKVVGAAVLLVALCAAGFLLLRGGGESSAASVIASASSVQESVVRPPTSAALPPSAQALPLLSPPAVSSAPKVTSPPRASGRPSGNAHGLDPYDRF